MNTQPANFSSSGHTDCFHSDPDERLLVLGIDTPSVDELVTKSDDMFPSYIAAHPFPTLTPDTYATTAPPVVVIHGKATRALTTMSMYLNETLFCTEYAAYHTRSTNRTSFSTREPQPPKTDFHSCLSSAVLTRPFTLTPEEHTHLG